MSDSDNNLISNNKSNFQLNNNNGEIEEKLIDNNFEVDDLLNSEKKIVNDDDSEKTDSETFKTKDKVDRVTLWMNLLGVRNKPNFFINWDHLYNLKSQKILRDDCRVLIKKYSNETKFTVEQLENLLTLYCKKRKVDYDPNNDWTTILEKLILLPFNESTLLNVFYAITTKYIPRLSNAFELFRLIIQYHDPELCSYLDSLKIQTEDYSSDWFKSLLSKSLDTNLCWQIWDEYFARGDPFLIFFIALTFMRCARDDIFATRNADEVREHLRKAPSLMKYDDVEDLLDICYIYLNYTPSSIREDFHCMLFGANFMDECLDFSLNRLMCVPISVQELYKRVIDNTISSTMTYFVIDTRSQKVFNAGSIPGSYNLNGKMIVDEPEKFDIAIKSLMSFKEENCKKDHICFLGSGLEDDDLHMMMIISRFLQQNKEHISYVDGGYKALHAMLKDIDSINKLSNHFNVNDCTECTNCGKELGESKGWSIMERMKKVMRNRKSSFKTNKILLSLKNQSEFEDTKLDMLKHVNSTDRFGKRYRNVQSVFSINDDSLSSEDEINLSPIEKNFKNSEKLKWSEVIKKPEILNYFQGEEVFPDKTSISCFIALTRTHMHVFHIISKKPGYVHSFAHHALTTIMRVTSKKKIPEYLTFKFGYELSTGEVHINRVQCFIIPKAGDCATAVKSLIVALKL